MANDLGEADYRRGGIERLRESRLLLRDEFFAGSVYLGGRAVESMLRALVWKFDPEVRTGRRSLETGHNLLELLSVAANLGALPSAAVRARLFVDVQYVGQFWFNSLRFISTEKLRSRWHKLRLTTSKRTLKVVAHEFNQTCTTIVDTCEAICRA